MNKKLKEIGKAFIYPTLNVLDVIAPRLSTAFVQRFFRYRALNDLRIQKECDYDSLGTYVTLHDKEPAFYNGFIKTYYMDAEGLPVAIEEGKECRHVVALAQYGLMEYGYYLANSEPLHRDNCLRAAKALLRMQDDKGGWSYPFKFFHEATDCNLPSGWYSAMGQGQTISLFVRANALEENVEYQVAAQRALGLLKIPVEDGGLLAKIGKHHILEEYPTSPASYTLNGFMFAIIGLYDMANSFQAIEAQQMFSNMMRTLQAILPLYDDDTYSSYDLSHLTNAPRKKDKSRKYHILHVRLLQALDSIEHHDVFSFYIEKWGKNWR